MTIVWLAAFARKELAKERILDRRPLKTTELARKVTTVLKGQVCQLPALVEPTQTDTKLSGKTNAQNVKKVITVCYLV